MRSLWRIISNGLALLSLALGLAIAALWVQSYRTTTALEFWRAENLWEAVSERGRLRIDNTPQRNIESARLAKERAALQRECVKLAAQADALKRDLKSADEEKQGKAEAELSRLKQLSAINNRARAAAIAKPAYTTMLVSHSVRHGVAVGLSAMPWMLWCALAARSSVRSRRRRENCLCEHCGYDLRATPDRCPECGALPARLE